MLQITKSGKSLKRGRKKYPKIFSPRHSSDYPGMTQDGEPHFPSLLKLKQGAKEYQWKSAPRFVLQLLGKKEIWLTGPE